MGKLHYHVLHGPDGEQEYADEAKLLRRLDELFGGELAADLVARARKEGRVRRGAWTLDRELLVDPSPRGPYLQDGWPSSYTDEQRRDLAVVAETQARRDRRQGADRETAVACARAGCQRPVRGAARHPELSPFCEQCRAVSAQAALREEHGSTDIAWRVAWLENSPKGKPGHLGIRDADYALVERSITALDPAGDGVLVRALVALTGIRIGRVRLVLSELGRRGIVRRKKGGVYARVLAGEAAASTAPAPSRRKGRGRGSRATA